MKAATLHKHCFSSPDNDVHPGALRRACASHSPRRRATAAPERACAGRPNDSDIGEDTGEEGGTCAAQGHAQQRGLVSVPRVLHVDSDDGAAATLTALLTPDASVVHASTLADARRLLRSEIFSLCILDPGLSDGDGAALLPALASTPLLVYSARQPEWRDQPRPYLPKPWTSPRQLWSTVSTMLGIAPGMTAGD